MRDLDLIRSAVPLSQVIADMTGEQPRKRGRELVVRCPFHDDRNPSLRINDEKNGGVWRCDPCHKGGDVFAFVMDHAKVPLPGAVELLRERYGIETGTTSTRRARRVSSWGLGVDA